MLPEDVLNAYTDLKLAGHKELYALELGGLFFLFRPLTYTEHNIVNDLDSKLDSSTLSDTINRIAVLHWPIPMEEWEETCMPAHPDTLANAIQKKSGYDNAGAFVKTIDEAREALSQVANLIILYICSAFKGLLPKDVEDMTLEEQAKHLALAEQILGNPLDLQKLLGIGEETEPEPDALNYPVPEGMESTDINSMLSENAPGLEIPDVGKLLKGN